MNSMWVQILQFSPYIWTQVTINFLISTLVNRSVVFLNFISNEEKNQIRITTRLYSGPPLISLVFEQFAPNIWQNMWIFIPYRWHPISFHWRKYAITKNKIDLAQKWHTKYGLKKKTRTIQKSKWYIKKEKYPSFI